MRPFGLDPGTIAPALVNRALERESWAQACLAAHAGRSFMVAVGPASALMRIDAAGKVEAAPRSGTVPDLKLSLSPLAVPSFLAQPSRWDELVVVDGDPALASTLKGLAETLPWFVERVFAGAFGPIVGQRFADAGRRLLALPEYAAGRVGESVGSFVRDEADVATRGDEARSFGDEVAAVAKDVDALAARLDALAARLAPGGDQAA
jgi:ubiquinone biosynthesis protein UbiJ